MGGPYAPKDALLGGRPTVSFDVPICAVFLALFIAGAASHMTLFRCYLARGHKFIPSAITFGCMSRIIANIIRISWACRVTNIRIAIAAQIFVAAGVLLMFILNLIFAQRMVRAVYPKVGCLVVVNIIAVITTVVQSMYTLNKNTQRIDRDIQLYCLTYFAIISFLPLPLVLLVVLSPNRKRIEQFGSGSWIAKVLLVILVGSLLCLGASFRAGTKPCFYIFDFGIDILVVAIFLFGRIDQLFWVPNGSSKVCHYRGLEDNEKASQSAQNRQGEGGHDLESRSSSLSRDLVEEAN
ncbi:uncharacterized protein CDV56_103508 [Aspergillus thermomutatus]|uniref:G-protein coupled receptors family 3 profile domain-containing protein n=1 Tax=Aspergillus thermomutatus TaxID=41047 RepID=A0A397GJL8_ASPTH|nr:uncharacterized protein CDV56_103508 [Aspergillus thermomutatus]RHZ50379.1 hypothetical protein CDV56_103508 [Aspergillus thermomutatus]